MDQLSFSEIEEGVTNGPAIDDMHDERDFKYGEFFSAVDAPESFRIREGVTSVKNQGKRGACVSFSSTAITECLNSIERGDPSLNLSEEYLFAKIKAFDISDYGYHGYGAFLRSGAKALVKHGTCLETTAPYNPSGSEHSWKNFVTTPSMNEEASEYRMINYVKVGKAKELIKQALVTSGAPLLMGMTLYESYRKAKYNGGIIPIPSKGERRIGGHAMALVGYDDTHMIFKNSWGSKWGNKGYVLFPWDGLNKIHNSIWSFVDLVTNPHVKEENLIEGNKKFLKPHQIEAWEKAHSKGIVTSGSRPDHTLTKGDLMVFLDRLGLLD